MDVISAGKDLLLRTKKKTNIKGVFAAGDAIKDMKFVIFAAGEGTKAGVAMNMELQQEELKNLLKKISLSHDALKSNE